MNILWGKWTGEGIFPGGGGGGGEGVEHSFH